MLRTLAEPVEVGHCFLTYVDVNEGYHTPNTLAIHASPNKDGLIPYLQRTMSQNTYHPP